ncbi:FAD-dependent oxidoreductase domain-containing protein 1 [Manis javanica]|nr:FAD-dependent oxidoreductase domain-containing protein 1 [Manis javanica]
MVSIEPGRIGEGLPGHLEALAHRLAADEAAAQQDRARPRRGDSHSSYEAHQGLDVVAVPGLGEAGQELGIGEQEAANPKPPHQETSAMKAEDIRPATCVPTTLSTAAGGRQPGHGTSYTPTYWVGTAGRPPDDGPVTGDMDVDVAIVARSHGLCNPVLARERHACRGAGRQPDRLEAAPAQRRPGAERQRAPVPLRSGLRAGARTWRSSSTPRSARASRPSRTWWPNSPECEPQPGGHLYIAHREKKLDFLRNETQIMREVFFDARMLSPEELRRDYVNDADSHGAMHEPDGIGVHPLKLAFGYLRKARGALGDQGAPGQSGAGRRDAQQRAPSAPAASCGRAPLALPRAATPATPCMAACAPRSCPSSPNSLVTRPLTEQELEATSSRPPRSSPTRARCAFTTAACPTTACRSAATSAVTSADAPHPHGQAGGRPAPQVPALKGITIDYSWWGWVDVSHDMMPRVFQPDPAQSIFYAVGYGGNGVSFSAHAGRRIAERIAGRQSKTFELPIYNSELEYPNVFNMRFLYHWYYMRDEEL